MPSITSNLKPVASANASIPPRPEIIDDKSPHCIPFILSHLSTHLSSQTPSNPPSSPISTPQPPFFIGLNGIQGAGKTTLVSSLYQTLTSPFHNLSVLVLSIDDLYLRHEDQVRLAEEHKENKLVQHRGEPGTHDIELARKVFSALKEGREVPVPEYDKSAHGGKGDRVDPARWRIVNKPGETKIQVVIFEGWCVGYRALSEPAVAAAWEAPSLTLKQHKLSDLLFVNSKLKDYAILNDAFDAFIHIDAEETGYVYAWRQEQEAALRREKGTGMSEEQVTRFVDGYYPAYELYVEALRKGVFEGSKREGMRGRQLRLVVGRDRRVKEVVEI